MDQKIVTKHMSDQTALVASFIFLATLTVVGIITRPLMPIDETRYVGVAWEMWLRGDFLVPFKNGEIYSHKPPLLFWMLHLGWTLFGVNDVWPRLVTPIFAALALLTTCRLANRLWPQHSGLGGQAALILSGTLLWIIFSTALMFDTVLTFWVLIGMHGILRAAANQRRGFALLGIAVGLGLLTKGPVILLHLLPITALAPWWNPGISWKRWFAGVALALALGATIALAWAIPAGIAGGQAYRDEIFWAQTADRMVNSFAHERPIWWYLPLLPFVLFPWLIWPGFWKALAQQRHVKLDRGLRFCVAWILPTLIALSCVSGKQPHYLLPLLPAFALILARILSSTRTAQITLPAILMLALAAGLLALASGQISSFRNNQVFLPTFWPGTLFGVIVLSAFWANRRGTPSVIILAGLSVAALACTQWAAKDTLMSQYDVRSLAQEIRKVQEEGRVVANIGSYHAQYHFAGRLEKPLVELRNKEAVAEWLAANPQGYAVAYPKSKELANSLPARSKHAYHGKWAVLLDASSVEKLPASDKN